MGSNITTTPTAQIQTNLGIKSDGDYGAQTTAAVKAFQTANNLTVDGVFGPKTEAAYNTKFGTPSSLITTSTPSQNKFIGDSNALTQAERMLGINSTPAPSPTTPTTGGTSTDPNAGGTGGTSTPAPDTTSTDPILTGLDSLKTAKDNATNALIASTQASYQNKTNALDKEFDKYKGGLQLLGIQSNQAQATPDLLMGHIHQAALDEMDKVNALKSEEAKTIMDAKTAQANNDFKTLGDKMARLKAIQTEKNDAIKNVSNTVNSQAKTAAVEAHDIYDVMSTLNDTDKEQFIIEVAKKFNLPVNSLVTALTDEKAKRDKASLQTENTQSTIDKREAPKTASPTTVKNAEIDQGKNVLKTGTLPDGTKIGNPQGSDGFFDPGVYTQLFTHWKGTAKDFVSKYPIVGTINPTSYKSLPTALQQLLPKASTGRKS